MFFKRLKLVFCIKLTQVLLVYSANLQQYSVLDSHRSITVFELSPMDKIEPPLMNYTLTCPEKTPLECTASFYTTWKLVFNYRFLSDKFKNSTGTYISKSKEVDFNDKVHLTRSINVDHSNGYYYNSDTDSLTVWRSHLSYYNNSRVFYQGLVNETVDSNKKPTNLRFSVCNNTYNLKISDEFGPSVFKTNQKNVYVRKELTTSSMTKYDCSVGITPEVIKTTTSSQTPPVTKTVETSGTMNKTIVHPEPTTTKKATTKLVTSTTTRKTTTTRRTTITTTTQKIHTSATSTVIPTQDVYVQGDTKSNTETTKTLLIILISLVVFWIFLTPFLVYYCKKRPASDAPATTFSTKRIKSTYTEWLTSHKHLRESAQPDAHTEENVYSTPKEDCALEVPKPDYDYVMVIRENKVLTENEYMVLKDRRTNTDDTYLVPKEEEKEESGYVNVRDKRTLIPSSGAPGSSRVTSEVGDEYMVLQYLKKI